MGSLESSPAAGDEPTFEACLNELQELVRSLEEGTLGLDESIARFERGIACLRHCYQALEQAEQRIELLTGFDRDGNPVTKPFDSAATHDPSNHSPEKRQKRKARKETEPRGESQVSDPEGGQAPEQKPSLF
jgi:exodeoxyribonuclease VII small subunit